MKNIDIRMIVSDKGITYRQIAASMRVTPCHLSRLMGKELSSKQRDRILNAIDTIEAGKGANEC